MSIRPNDNPTTSANTGRKRTMRVARLSSAALSVVAMLSSQAAFAMACPAGPKIGTTSKNWDIDKIRDFGVRMGLPEKQLMLCLHRGFHDNTYDAAVKDANGADVYKQYIKDVPDNSEQAITQAFNYAPCVEVDVAYRYAGGKSEGDFAFHTILSHDAKPARQMAQMELMALTGGKIPNPDCNTPYAFGNAHTVWTCPNVPSYDPNTKTYKGPLQSYNDANFATVGPQFISAYGGFLRTSLSQNIGTQGTKLHAAQNLGDILQLLANCSPDNIGLIVLDAKDLGALEQIRNLIFYLGVHNSSKLKHLMVKIKPWKLYRSDNSDGSLNYLVQIVTDLTNAGVPVIDTAIQGGIYNTNGATSKNSDYFAANEYYKIRAELDAKSSEQVVLRGIEISMPGTDSFDPINSGNQRLWSTGLCNNDPTTLAQRLMSQINNMSKYCNTLSRTITGTNKVTFPQIWGWVPLEDGKAEKVVDGNGNSVLIPVSGVPAPQNTNYLKIGNEYPFGISFGSTSPNGLLIDRDTLERNPNHVTDNIGARAITIDSIWWFNNKFPGYTTNQSWFMK